jgi:septum formation protein
MNSLPNLYLASQSPRRRQLLETLGLPFKVKTSSAPEEMPQWDTVDPVTKKNAVLKAEAVLKIVGEEDAIIIGADTLVLIDKDVLGKPANAAEAKETLRKLSGRKQTVVTGLALISRKYGRRECTVKSSVFFKKLSEQDIDEYTQTKEPYDKSGAYAVQGLSALFIDKIEGSYTNVMGLPIEKLLEELAALTGTRPYQWFLKI